MGCSILELGEKLSHEEFLEWHYYFHSEPNDIEKLRQQLAMHTTHTLSIQGAKDLKFSDFYLDFSKREKVVENEDDALALARKQNKEMKEKFLKQIKGE